MKVGLIGERLNYSFSKIIHEKIADYSYDLIELNQQQFVEFMENKDFDCINVTIPYKQKVMPYCSTIQQKALDIGAVNAIKKVDGKLIGTNTDFDGLKMMIERRFDLSDKVIAICGSGATSKTAKAVCVSLKAKEIIQVARNKDLPYISYQQMKQRKDIQIIINTTSVGTNPNYFEQIVDLNDFKNCVGVIDVVYNPLTTSLTYQAKRLNIKYVNGLEMLVGQAVSAIEFFTNKTIDKSLIDQVTNDIRLSKQNIVLIGMPGCGKTSLGKLLSEKLNYDFIDIDSQIVKETNKTIPEIFKEGEEVFRDIETSICKKLTGLNHTVISCGGGVIKREINMHALSLNGLIIYIKRDIDKLELANGRPLSQNRSDLEKLEKERSSLYYKYSDKVIENNEAIEETLEKLMEAANEDISN